MLFTGTLRFARASDSLCGVYGTVEEDSLLRLVGKWLPGNLLLPSLVETESHKRKVQWVPTGHFGAVRCTTAYTPVFLQDKTRCLLRHCPPSIHAPLTPALAMPATRRAARPAALSGPTSCRHGHAFVVHLAVTISAWKPRWFKNPNDPPSRSAVGVQVRSSSATSLVITSSLVRFFPYYVLYKEHSL